jgi:hypothetical protein
MSAKICNLDVDETAMIPNGMKDHPSFLHCIPEEHRSLELCKYCFQRDPYVHTCIPDKFKSSEMYEWVVKQMPYFVSCVPINYKTEEMCEVAFRFNPLSFIDFPEKCKTIKLCVMAIAFRESFISSVPKKVDEIIKSYHESIKDEILDNSSDKDMDSFLLLSSELRTQQMCNDLVKYNIAAFPHVPNKFKTYDMCVYVLDRNSVYMRCIPQELEQTMRVRDSYTMVIKKKIYLDKYIFRQIYVPKDNSVGVH